MTIGRRITGVIKSTEEYYIFSYTNIVNKQWNRICNLTHKISLVQELLA